MKLQCNSETGSLRSVVLGYPHNFHNNGAPVEIINKTQAKFFTLTSKPTAESLQSEFLEFQQTLENYGVKVFVPEPCDVPDQLTPRDIGFVIGDRFFLARMAKQSRVNEYQGIRYLIDQFGPEKVVRVPEGMVIEGGDIIVEGKNIFIGLSQRTDRDGCDWLAQQITDYNIIPVHLKTIAEGEDCLHLDCVFVPVGKGNCLIYPEGIKGEIPLPLKEFKWIVVTSEEQSQLATNVLSLSDHRVISRTATRRVNAELRKLGLEVIVLKYDEAPKTGGSFRCCTLPLWRD